MAAEELLAKLSSLGYAATAEDVRLKLHGPCQPPEDLERRIIDRRDELMKILREDEELRRTGIIQSGRQVFGMAREYFGSTRSFDSAEHPPTKMEMWTDPDKEAYFFPERYQRASLRDGGDAYEIATVLYT
jgi:hypothetical protein